MMFPSLPRPPAPRPPDAPSLLACLLAALACTLPATTRAQDCLIEPYQRVEIRSPVPGLIKAIHVERGSRVQKGQLLVELDAGVELASLAGARYRAQMQGQVRSAAGRVKFAQAKQQRFDELSKQKYASQHERDEAEAEAEVAQADLLEARDNRELAALEAQRLSAQVEQRRLRSPIAGLVTDRSQHTGELAQSAEGGKPILKLAQIHPLRVELVLPLARHGAIREGQTAIIEPEPPFKGRHSAKVKLVDRVMDAPSGTFRVLLELPNPDGSITAGVKCKASFQ